MDQIEKHKMQPMWQHRNHELKWQSTKRIKLKWKIDKKKKKKRQRFMQQSGKYEKV